jgi:asparagine N-glycosylation enzyme membrane subunit Stt3
VLFCCAPLRGLRERPCRRSSFFAGQIVRRSPKRNLLNWSALAVLAALAGVVALGLAAQGLSLAHWLAALAFGAGVLVWAGLWQWTWRRAESAPPLTRGKHIWNFAVFLGWLAALAAIVCWYFADRAGRTP